MSDDLNIVHVGIIPLGKNEITVVAELPVGFPEFMDGPNLLSCGLRKMKVISSTDYDTLLAFDAVNEDSDLVKKLIDFRGERDAAWRYGIAVDSHDGEKFRKQRMNSVIVEFAEAYPRIVNAIISLYDHKGNLTVHWIAVPEPEHIETIEHSWRDTPCQNEHYVPTNDGKNWILVHVGCLACECVDELPHITDRDTWTC